MATLQGKQIADTYQSLIKTCDNNSITGSIQLTDGCGIATSLCINTASNGITVGGDSTFTNDLNVQGDLNVTGNTVSCDIQVNGNNICDSTNSVKINFSATGTTACGNLSATGDLVAFCTSDRRLKDSLEHINDSQIIVSSLTGYSFDWNEESKKYGKDIGLIAQDVQEVLPLAVQERDNGFLAVDYVKLIPVLVEEVKRLNGEINELKNKINN
jgi:hypothetical protein